MSHENSFPAKGQWEGTYRTNPEWDWMFETPGVMVPLVEGFGRPVTTGSAQFVADDVNSPVLLPSWTGGFAGMGCNFVSEGVFEPWNAWRWDAGTIGALINTPTSARTVTMLIVFDPLFGGKLRTLLLVGPSEIEASGSIIRHSFYGGTTDLMAAFVPLGINPFAVHVLVSTYDFRIPAAEGPGKLYLDGELIAVGLSDNPIGSSTNAAVGLGGQVAAKGVEGWQGRIYLGGVLSVAFTPEQVRRFSADPFAFLRLDDRLIGFEESPANHDVEVAPSTQDVIEATGIDIIVPPTRYATTVESNIEVKA